MFLYENKYLFWILVVYDTSNTTIKSHNDYLTKAEGYPASLSLTPYQKSQMDDTAS